LITKNTKDTKDTKKSQSKRPFFFLLSFVPLVSSVFLVIKKRHQAASAATERFAA
jgi:hypothetical protein